MTTSLPPDDSASADGKDLSEQFGIENIIRNSQSSSNDPNWKTEELTDAEKVQIERMEYPDWLRKIFGN